MATRRPVSCGPDRPASRRWGLVIAQLACVDMPPGYKLKLTLSQAVSAADRHGRSPDHHRSLAAQRRRLLGAALLRGARADPSERAGSGHRRYPRAVLRRIAFIVFAQKIGLTLDEIGAELAKLPRNRVAGPRGLGEALAPMDPAHRRADRRARAAARRPDRTASAAAACRCSMPARQSGRPGWQPRSRSALLDGREAASLSPARVSPARVLLSPDHRASTPGTRNSPQTATDSDSRSDGRDRSRPPRLRQLPPVRAEPCAAHASRARLQFPHARPLASADHGGGSRFAACGRRPARSPWTARSAVAATRRPSSNVSSLADG